MMNHSSGIGLNEAFLAGILGLSPLAEWKGEHGERANCVLHDSCLLFSIHDRVILACVAPVSVSMAV